MRFEFHLDWEIDNDFFEQASHGVYANPCTQVGANRITRISALFRRRTLPVFSFVCDAGYFFVWLILSVAFSSPINKGFAYVLNIAFNVLRTILLG